MHKRWVLLLFAGLILSMAIYLRHPLSSVNSSHACQSFNQVCVACPQLNIDSLPESFRLVQIEHHDEFITLQSRQQLGIDKRECFEFMKMIDQSFLRVKEAKLIQIVHLESVTISAGKRSLVTDSYSDNLLLEGELLVFYRSRDFKPVSISVQNASNLVTIQVLARLIPLSMLLALFGSWFAKFCGYSSQLQLRHFVIQAWVLLAMLWNSGSAQWMWWIEGMSCAYLLVRVRGEVISGPLLFCWSLFWGKSSLGTLGMYGALGVTLWQKRKRGGLISYYIWVSLILAVSTLCSYAWMEWRVWWLAQVLRVVQLPCLLFAWQLTSPQEKQVFLAQIEQQQ